MSRDYKDLPSVPTLETKDESKKTVLKQNSVNKKINQSEFDFSLIEQKLHESIPKLKTLENKDVFLVIGKTQVGKSTTIDYMLGYEMEKKKKLGEWIAAPKVKPGDRFAPVGDGGSKTSCAEAFDCKEGFAFCDTTGFRDTRTKNVKISSQINSQIAINMMRGIRGVMVVLDRYSLIGAREGLRDLCEILANTFIKDLEGPIDQVRNIARSLIFIVTKYGEIDSDSHSDVMTTIDSLITSFENDLATINIKSAEDYQRQKKEVDAIFAKLQILKLMQNNKHNVVIIDVFDKGGSRAEIFEKLKKLEPISKDLLDFGKGDKDRKRFNDVLRQILDQGTLILQDVNDHPKKLARCMELEKEFEAKISNYYDLNTVIDKGLPEKEYINKLEERAKLIKRTIQTNKVLLKLHRDQVERYLGSLKKLSSDDFVVFEKLTVDKARVTYKKSFPSGQSAAEYLFKVQSPFKIERVKLVAKKILTTEVIVRSLLQSSDQFDGELPNHDRNIFGFNDATRLVPGGVYDYQVVHFSRSLNSSSKTENVIGMMLEVLLSPVTIPVVFLSSVDVSLDASVEIYCRKYEKFMDEIKSFTDLINIENNFCVEIESDIKQNVAELKMTEEKIANDSKDIKLEGSSSLVKIKGENDVEKKKCEIELQKLRNEIFPKLKEKKTEDFQINIKLFRSVAFIVGALNLPFDDFPLAGEFLKHYNEFTLSKEIEVLKSPKALPIRIDELNNDEEIVSDEVLAKLEADRDRKIIEAELLRVRINRIKDRRPITALRAQLDSSGKLNEFERRKLEHQQNFQLLYIAVKEKSKESLITLASKKIDFRIQEEKTGNTILHYAAGFGAEIDILYYLIKDHFCAIDSLNEKKETPLFHAVKNECLKTAEYLISAGAKLEVVDQDNLTPLEVALRQGLSIAIIEILLKYDLDEINSLLNSRGQPLLHVIAQNGHESALRYFIENKNADINLKNKDGFTPLCAAVRANKINMVKKLVEYQAKFDIKGEIESQILSDHSLDPSIKVCLQQYSAEMERVNILRRKEVSPIVRELYSIFTSDGQREVTMANEVSNLQLLLQEAFLLSSNLPALLASWSSKDLVIESKEVKIRSSQSSEINRLKNDRLEIKQILYFLKFQLLNEIDQTFDNWETLLSEESDKQSVFRSKVISTINQSLQECLKLTACEVRVKNIAYQVICSLQSLKFPLKLSKGDLHQWIVNGVSMVDYQDLNIINSALIQQLVSDLKTTLQDCVWDSPLSFKRVIHETQYNLIFNLRVRSAIKYCLYQKNRLSSRDKLAYEIALQLIDKLKINKTPFLFFKSKETMKEESIPLIIYRMQKLFSPYLSEKINPDILNGLVTSCFEKLKQESMEYFCIDLSSQEEFDRKLQNAIDTWILNVQNNTDLQYPLTTKSFVENDQKTGHSLVGTSKKFTSLSHKQQQFVDNFCAEFEKFYCVYKALDLKMVRRLPDKVDQLASLVQEYRHARVNIDPRISGVSALEVPVGAIAEIITKLAVYRKDRNVEEAAKRVGWLFCNRPMSENANFIRVAAEYIAKRYQLQINHLTSLSIAPLGACAANRALQYITASDDNLMKVPSGFLKWISVSIANFKADKRYGPKIISDFKDTLSALITGVIEGTSADDEIHLSSENGDIWLPVGIFRNVGFILKTENGDELYSHPDLNKISHPNNQQNGVLLYGYSFIEPWEVELIKKAGYKLDNKTNLNEVLNRFPSMSQRSIVESGNAFTMIAIDSKENEGRARNNPLSRGLI